MGEFILLAKKPHPLKPLSKWKIISGYLCGALIIIVVSWTYYTTKREKDLLIKSGQITQGVIIKTVSRKRGLDVQYEFFVSGRRFTSWGKTYNELRTGDTLEVVYLRFDPIINRLKSELMKK